MRCRDTSEQGRENQTHERPTTPRPQELLSGSGYSTVLSDVMKVDETRALDRRKDERDNSGQMRQISKEEDAADNSGSES